MRKYLRYSLRTLLAGMLICCPLLAWYGPTLKVAIESWWLFEEVPQLPEHHLLHIFGDPNAETREFALSGKIHLILACPMEMDDQGYLTSIMCHPCQAIDDTEIDAISQLSRLESLTIFPGNITDQGLQQLADMKSLKTITFGIHTPETPELIRKLKLKRPDLTVK